jgi:hypothetical protein
MEDYERSRRNRFSIDVEEKIPTQTTWKRTIRIIILVLYSLLTIHEFVRGFIHTFLYEEGLHDVSGLGTKDILCDNRLSLLMISYGGNNLETFIIRCAILYYYTKYDNGYLFIIWSCVGPMLFQPTTVIVSSVGNIDVGDAQLPGKEAMLIRSIVSGVIIILAVANYYLTQSTR